MTKAVEMPGMLPKTLGELKQAGYKVLSVKDEIRKNLITRLKNKEEIFPGIIGYDKTVTPQIINAILAKHDVIFLGCAGRRKPKLPVCSLSSLMNTLL